MPSSADGTIYTGNTDSLEVRLGQHQQRYFPRCDTRKRRKLTLVWAEALGTRGEALEAERPIKAWTNAKKRGAKGPAEF